MQKGFVLPFILIGIVLLILAAGGAFYLGRSTLNNGDVSSPPTSQNSSTPQPSPSEQVFCAQDVKQCPDGTYVARQGANCEFAPCPSSNPDSTWRTHHIKTLNLEFRLPQILNYKNEPKEILIPGEKGTYLYYGYSMVEDRFGIGATFKDYQEGREGGFLYLQGYAKVNNEYSARSVMNKKWKIPSNLVEEIQNKNGVKILIITGTNHNGEFSSWPLEGTPGKGWIGALINTNNDSYPGLAIAMELTDKYDERLFKEILSTFKFTD